MAITWRRTVVHQSILLFSIDRVPEVCDRLRLEESAEFNSSDNKRKSREETLVHEWSLSLTTLEDVFLEVTRKSNFVYEKSEVISINRFGVY